MKNKGINIKAWLIYTPIIMALLFTVVLLVFRLEGEKPNIAPTGLTDTIGISQKVTLTISDTKSGIKKIWVGILKDGKETVLIEKVFKKTGLLRGNDIKQMPLEVLIEPKTLGLSDGKALLRLAVWDCSWRQWGRGNTSYLEKEIMIDTKPPEIEVLSSHHNIIQGGAALIIYRLSEACATSGVRVGSHFFPGYAGYFDDSQLYMSFFTLGYDQGTDTNLRVVATDMAGNEVSIGFYNYLKRKNFRADRIVLDDKFLNWKMPEFEKETGTEGALLDKFLKVNRDIRQANYESIQKIVSDTDKTMHWKGTFLRLPGSATRARFAEKRAYIYKGSTIDHQVHMGVDLASVAKSPVPVANSGRVSFVGTLGIYGKVVIVDHGFGLSSLYAHLSRISVQKEQLLQKGDILGYSGTTGLAGGDHLHFSVLVHDTFVNPLEWWDINWIKNNIVSKIEQAVP